MVLGTDWEHKHNFDGAYKIHLTLVSSRLLNKISFMHLCELDLNVDHEFPM